MVHCFSKVQHSNLPEFSSRRWCGIIVVLLVLLGGCDETSPSRQQTEDPSTFVKIDTISVPVFSTPEEQLNYTRTWFAEKKRKQAALRAFIRLYPEKRRSCGMVALDLAYLQLGSDYRFAHEQAYFDALAGYHDILQNYSDIPAVMAKALWYIGWISTDLLYDRNTGLKAYWRLVREYPHEPVSLLPSAPWVSITFSQKSRESSEFVDFPRNQWAALALVEIIKYTENGEDAWRAFLRLWQEYRNDVAVGFGLRLVLRRKYHKDEATEIARQFLDENLSNIHLSGDIRDEIIDSGQQMETE